MRLPVSTPGGKKLLPGGVPARGVGVVVLPEAPEDGAPGAAEDASKRGLAGPMTAARKEPVVIVELDTRQDADDTVSLEGDRDTGETQIVVADIRDESLLVFPVPGANAGAAFRHPFRYAQ
jgi:hypothetical protein